MKLLKNAAIVLAAVMAFSTVSHAGVIVGATRVIFDGSKKEASVSVTNRDDSPFLVQTWIEKNEESADKPPFVITPPLYRLDKDQQTMQRIILAGNVPQDKESLYWINIKSIPSAEAKENTLQIAIKTRIKLIYRPVVLNKNTPEEFTEKLSWQRSGSDLVVTNSSPYVMNFSSISVDGKKLEDISYVLPGSSKHFSLPKGAVNGAVKYQLIDDFGGLGKEHNVKI